MSDRYHAVSRSDGLLTEIVYMCAVCGAAVISKYLHDLVHDEATPSAGCTCGDVYPGGVRDPRCPVHGFDDGVEQVEADTREDHAPGNNAAKESAESRGPSSTPGPSDASPGHVICPVCKGDGTGAPFGADGCARCGGEGEVPLSQAKGAPSDDDVTTTASKEWDEMDWTELRAEVEVLARELSREMTDYDHHASPLECEGCNALWSHAYAKGKADSVPSAETPAEHMHRPGEPCRSDCVPASRFPGPEKRNLGEPLFPHEMGPPAQDDPRWLDWMLTHDASFKAGYTIGQQTTSAPIDPARLTYRDRLCGAESEQEGDHDDRYCVRCEAIIDYLGRSTSAGMEHVYREALGRIATSLYDPAKTEAAEIAREALESRDVYRPPPHKRTLWEPLFPHEERES